MELVGDQRRPPYETQGDHHLPSGLREVAWLVGAMSADAAAGLRLGGRILAYL
jgi:hypothetical protein